MVETESSGRQRAHRGGQSSNGLHLRGSFRVKMRRTQNEHKESALAVEADLRADEPVGRVRATRQHRRRSKQLGWNAPVPRSKSSSVHTVWQQIRVQRATNGCGIWL